MNLLTVYVAGPYRADTVYEIKRNIRAAEDATETLISMGYAVICPHLITKFCDGLQADEWFLWAGLTLLDKADFVVLTHGWEASAGTQKEIEFARKSGMPILRLTQMQLYKGHPLSLEQLTNMDELLATLAEEVGRQIG